MNEYIGKMVHQSEGEDWHSIRQEVYGNEIFGEEEPSQEKRELLERVQKNIFRETGVLTEKQEQVQEWFVKMFEKILVGWSKKFDQLDSPHLSKEIRDWMREKRLDIPTIRFYQSRRGEDFLQRTGFRRREFQYYEMQNERFKPFKGRMGGEYQYKTTHGPLFGDGETKELAEDSLLIVFQLPKPLAQFWRKSDHEDPKKNTFQDIRQMVIEWGRLYEKMMPYYWSELSERGFDFHGTESYEGNMSLERLNPFGVHEPMAYYYLYEASFANLEKRTYEMEDEI